MAIDQGTPLPQSMENCGFLEAVVTDALSLVFTEYLRVVRGAGVTLGCHTGRILGASN